MQSNGYEPPFPSDPKPPVNSAGPVEPAPAATAAVAVKPVAVTGAQDAASKGVTKNQLVTVPASKLGSPSPIHTRTVAAVGAGIATAGIAAGTWLLANGGTILPLVPQQYQGQATEAFTFLGMLMAFLGRGPLSGGR